MKVGKKKISFKKVAAVCCLSLIVLFMTVPVMASVSSLYDVADWDLDCFLDYEGEYDVTYPSKINSYTNYMLVYHDGSHKTTYGQEAAGYYLFLGGDLFRVNTSYANNYYYLTLGTKGDCVLMYSSDGYTWSDYDSGNCTLYVASALSTNTSDIGYHADILECSDGVYYGAYDTSTATTTYELVIDVNGESVSTPGNSGIDSIVGDISSIISILGAFPAVIAALLGFLPAEYQLLIYVSFAVIFIVLGIKFVRG